MQDLSRPRAFVGAKAEQRAERAGHFFRALAGVGKSRAWCIENGIALQKASNESGNTAGGFLVPTDTDAAIISVRDTVGAFRRGAETRPSSTDNIVRPRRIGGLTASWVSEGGAIPASSFQLDALNSVLKKQGILALGSAELFEDTAADLGEFLVSEIGYAFAAVEDDCGFNGDGTSTYRGMSGLATMLVGLKSALTAASGHNTFLTLDATDLANLMGGIISSAVPGARWYCSQLCFAQTMCRLAGSAGGGYLSSGIVDGVRDAVLSRVSCDDEREAAEHLDDVERQIDALLWQPLDVVSAGRAARSDDRLDLI